MKTKALAKRKGTLLNYTTTVDATRTIAEIQQILAAKGALSVSVDYDNTGFPSAVTFKVMINGHEVWYRLPSKYDEAERALLASRDIPERFKKREQAIRVCWRILKDWVEAQMAIIQLGQAELAEVFFPYAIDATSGLTLFHHWAENQKMLGADTERPQLRAVNGG